MPSPSYRLLCACLAALAALAGCRGGDRAAGPLPHDVYVWQRAWTAPVRAAVAERSAPFRRVIALAAEVSWDRGAREVHRVELDPSSLAAASEVGLALRIGPFDAAADDHAAAGQALAALAAEVIASARRGGIAPAELQLDFDAPARRLGEYVAWVRAVRQRVDVPIAITALPAWLGADGLGELLDAADGFVLQVHSLVRPDDPDRLPPLCDPAAAREAVERAGSLGRPFRVALPTYGYRLGFTADRRFVGLTAEAPAKRWPADAVVRELRADAPAMARLRAGWEADRPATLEGLAWYRLPVDGDTLSWRWPTLRAVLAGPPPAPRLEVRLVRAAGGAVDVRLANVGLADARLPTQLRVAGPAAIPFGDATAGFALTREPGAARFVSAPDAPALPAGESRAVGWLRYPTPVATESLDATLVP